MYQHVGWGEERIPTWHAPSLRWPLGFTTAQPNSQPCGIALNLRARLLQQQVRHMASTTSPAPTVVRTSRGLSIVGTRITLYSIMDYLKAGWPAELIRDRLNLSDEQIADVLDYIEDHREEMEAEYARVLRQAEENRHYWQERNQQRFAQILTKGPPPGKEAIWTRLQAKKKQLSIP